MWANVYSQTASDREPVDLLIDPSNRVVTAGWAINTYSTNYDYVLVGYTSAGTVDFTNTYNTVVGTLSTWDQLRDLTIDNQNNFIVTGQAASEFYNDYLFKMITIKYGGIVVGQEDIEERPHRMLTVYPNPSTGIFTIMDASPEKIVSAKIYDMLCKEVFALDVENEVINMQDCRQGVYLLLIERQNAVKEHLLLILNK